MFMRFLLYSRYGDHDESGQFLRNARSSLGTRCSAETILGTFIHMKSYIPLSTLDFVLLYLGKIYRLYDILLPWYV